MIASTTRTVPVSDHIDNLDIFLDNRDAPSGEIYPFGTTNAPADASSGSYSSYFKVQTTSKELVCNTQQHGNNLKHQAGPTLAKLLAWARWCFRFCDFELDFQNAYSTAWTMGTLEEHDWSGTCRSPAWTWVRGRD